MMLACSPIAARLSPWPSSSATCARVGVVGVDVNDRDALAGPFGIEARRHLGLRRLAAAVVGDEADGLEAAGLEAARDALDHRGVGRLRDADRAGEPHVPARRIVAAFRHVRDDRRDQRMAELGRDRLGGATHDVVVLAEDHVRAVLLDAAGRHDDGRVAAARARSAPRPRSCRRARWWPAAARSAAGWRTPARPRYPRSR